VSLFLRFRHILRSPVFCALLLLVAVSSFCATRALAQDPPDIAMGLNPNSTYHGSDIDSVDMASGRLNVQIPLLIDHSQRGDLNFTYSLYFTSSSWYWSCSSEWDDNCWWMPAAPASGPGALQGVVFGADGFLYPGGEGYFDPNTCDTNWVDEAVEDNGAAHHLGTLTTYEDEPLTEESVDGSGILSAYSDDFSAQTLTNKNGIQFGPASWTNNYYTLNSVIEDPNGNQITFTQSCPAQYTCGGGPLTMTDTLGRTWTTTYNSTDVSNCPVSASNSTLWDTPGPNGTTREFKLCYSSHSISPNLGPCGYEICRQYGPVTRNLMTGVVLPDLTTWTFDYDNYGDIDEIDLPTGGKITYTWAISPWGEPGWPAAVRGPSYRRVYHDSTNYDTWQYVHDTDWDSTITVTDPLGNDTVYTCNSVYEVGCINVASIQYYSGTSTLLLRSGVNHAHFHQMWPKAGHLCPRYLQHSIEFAPIGFAQPQRSSGLSL
jgi:YD repeat-containing protein